MEEIDIEKVTRICTKCGRELPLSAFNKCCTGKYGRRAMCRECEHKVQNTPEARKRRRERELERRKDPDYVKMRNAKDRERRHTDKDSIKKALVRAAKQRAKTKGIPFDLSYSDIELPEVCPLLGISLTANEGRLKDDSYSLDRIYPSLGYVKGNVWVISNKANMIKSNASLDELKLLVHNLEIFLSSRN